jgi:N-acetylglutamate synthase-like GNAT family acetyltransferase
MDVAKTFRVARAKPSDAEDVPAFVSQATRGRVTVPAHSVLERFGAKGLWLVRDADAVIVGLAGWRAENLVARIDDFLVYPLELYETAGTHLVENIEQAAQELQCEVSMVFLPLQASPTLTDFFERHGYNRPEMEGLPRAWRETVQEAMERNRYTMMRQLREDLVMRPM